MRTLIAALMVFTAANFAQAQSSNQVIQLWPDAAPGARGYEGQDKPTLTCFAPDAAKASGAAIVICPGGGYQNLAPHEGEGYARWFADNGIAGFVLKYRLGSGGYRHPAMLQDAARAVRVVRSRAAEWKLDAKKIGIIGSSAGGHLASTLLTHFDNGTADAADPIERVSSRPDLGILCYAVITMGPFTHQGSRNNLLGTNPPPELVKSLSNELQVTQNTPPCFIWHTYEDNVVPVENSLQFAEALGKAHVPFDLHIYQKGGHGMGLGVREYRPGMSAQLHPWTRDCLYWLKEHGFVKEN
jgi:acetyl esterase/lipase